MKLRVALSGVIISTGVLVALVINTRLNVRAKFILGAGSFTFGVFSLAVVNKHYKYLNDNYTSIIKNANDSLTRIQEENKVLLETFKNRVEEATQDKVHIIIDLEQAIASLTEELKACDIRANNKSEEIASRYENEILVIKEQLSARYKIEVETAIAVSEELRDQLKINQSKLEYFYSRESNLIEEERRLESVRKQLNLFKEQLKLNQERSVLELEKSLLLEKEKFDELVRTNELYKHQLIKYQDLLGQVESENTNLKNSSKLRIAHGASYEAYLSQVIQNCYLENEINIAFAEFSKYGDSLVFKFYLVDSTKASKALKINKSLELSTGKFCHTEIKNGYLVVKTENEKSRDVSPIIVNNSSDKNTKRDYCWLDETFTKSHHDIIIGATGRGKSTLVDNIAALANIHFGGKAEIYVIDPKYPLTEWVFGGTKFKPQYKGLTAINENFQTSLDGLQDMVKSLQSRLDAATIAAENGNAAPEMKPQIWVVDESLLLRDEDKELHTKAINLLSRVGRALKIRIILLTQESNTAPNGLTISGSFNFTRYYLGDSAKVPSVLNREVKSAVEKNDIVSKTTALIEKGEKYFGLICPGEEKPFIEVLPPPGFYTPHSYPPQKDATSSLMEDNKVLEISGETIKNLPISSNPSSGDTIKKTGVCCPKCSREDVLKNGTRDSKRGIYQKFKCKDCSKQFSLKLEELLKV